MKRGAGTWGSHLSSRLGAGGTPLQGVSNVGALIRCAKLAFCKEISQEAVVIVEVRDESLTRAEEWENTANNFFPNFYNDSFQM